MRRWAGLPSKILNGGHNYDGFPIDQGLEAPTQGDVSTAVVPRPRGDQGGGGDDPGRSGIQHSMVAAEQYGVSPDAPPRRIAPHEVVGYSVVRVAELIFSPVSLRR